MNVPDEYSADRNLNDMKGSDLTCIEFRQYVGADPASNAAAILEHRLKCQACAEFHRQQLELTGRLAAALDIAVPDELAPRIRWRAANARTVALRWMAVAAGLVAAVTLSVLVWLGDADGPLTREIIAHVKDEARIMQVADERVGSQKVSAVLSLDDLALNDEIDEVTHAGLCPFRGHLIPHLVVEVDGEPVSILFLANETVREPERIDEDGYHGILVPVERGSMAIVSEREDLLVPVVEDMRRKVRWGI